MRIKGHLSCANTSNVSEGCFFFDKDSEHQHCPFEFLEKLRNEMPTFSLVLGAKDGKLEGGGDEVELNEEFPPAKDKHRSKLSK